MAGKKVYGKAFKITSKQVKAYGYAKPNPVPVTTIVAVNGRGAYKKAQSAKQAMSGSSKSDRISKARKLTQSISYGQMKSNRAAESSSNARKGTKIMKRKGSARSRVRAALNKNPKQPTPAQLKARQAFIAMVKAKKGKLKRNAGGVTRASAARALREMKREWRASKGDNADGARTRVMGAVKLPPIPTPPTRRAAKFTRGGTLVMPAVAAPAGRKVSVKVVKSKVKRGGKKKSARKSVSKKGTRSMAKKRSTKKSGKRAAKSVKKSVRRGRKAGRKVKKGTRKTKRASKKSTRKAKKGARKTKRVAKKSTRKAKRTGAKKRGRKKAGRKMRRNGLTRRQKGARKAAKTRAKKKAARSEAAKKAARKRGRKASRKVAKKSTRKVSKRRKVSARLQKSRKAARARRGKADRRKLYKSPSKNRKGRRMKRNGGMKSFFKRNGVMELIQFAGLVTAGVITHKAINAALTRFVIDPLLAPAAPVTPAATSGLPAAATPVVKLLASAAVAAAGTFAVKAVSKDAAVVNAVAGGMVASVLHQAVLTAVNLVSPAAAGYLSGDDSTAARLSAMYGVGGGIMPAYAPISGMGEYFEGANGVGEYFEGANGVGEYFEGTNGLGSYGANPDLYQAAAGYGMLGDNSDGYTNNINPSDDLDRQLTIAEAAAGVGAASYEASAGYGAVYQASAGYGNVETVPGADTWVPGSANPQLWAGVRPVDEPQSATAMVPAGVLESGGGAGIFG